MNPFVVKVVGVGALGSHAVQFLRNTNAVVRVIDFDRIEQKNQASQFHGKTHTGQLKVEALKQVMQMLWNWKIITTSSKLVKDNVDSLLGNANLVIDCLDNGEARRLVQKYVRETKTPCLHGALAANGEFGRVVWDEDFVIDESGVGAVTCEDGEHLPFIGITSAYLAKSAQDFIKTGKKIGYSISLGGVTRI